MKADTRHLVCVIVGLCGIGGIYGCRAQVLRHDQHIAAEQAQLFLQRLVIEQDVPSAHAMLREQDKGQLTLAQLKDVVSKEHQQGYPDKVWAIEFEPVPGQAAIQIFLAGENRREKFYYRVPMVGTVDSGYHPAGFYRGNGPYPSSSLRQKLG